jgi:Fic family protein
MNIIYFLLGILIGIGVGYWIGKKSKGDVQEIEKANQERTQGKEKAKIKILEMLAGKNEISNDEVEKALGVSDATATNYLQELENEGKLEQIGKEGRFVHYHLKA